MNINFEDVTIIDLLKLKEKLDKEITFRRINFLKRTKELFSFTKYGTKEIDLLIKKLAKGHDALGILDYDIRTIEELIEIKTSSNETKEDLETALKDFKKLEHKMKISGYWE